MNRLAIVPAVVTMWSSVNGIGYPGSDWTYLLSAMNDSNLELVRSNRAGEHDFYVEIP